jgi:sulfopyruvate decarboxylase subunit alpha
MTTPTEALWHCLRESRTDFFVSVPCKLLANMIVRLQSTRDKNVIYTPVSREEEGVGLMAGAWLAGRTPAMFMQNSGFGNSANAVLSLIHYYRIPILLVMSHRGSPGEPIEAQRPMGDAICGLMAAAGVTCLEVPGVTDLARVPEAITTARTEGRPLGLLLPFSFWEGDAA